MSSLNRATLIGNLGRDPEIRYTPDGTAVANVSIATTIRYKDKKGERQERTEWHRVSAFDRLAKVFEEYTGKGARVYVEGPLQTRKWTDKQGIERYTTQIAANKIVLLDGAKAGSEHAHDETGDTPPGVNVPDEDIPF